MEGDLLSAVFMTILSVFQSTPSAWRETGLCGRLLRRLSISIHSLRMEGDDAESQVFSRIFSFQSTPSAWRETRFRQIQLPPQCHFNPLPPHGGRREKTWQHTEQRNYFNPLPPHGGRLYQVLVLFCRQFHFNPLPPHGGRRASLMIIDDLIKFQSTPSAWRETSVHNWLERLLHISIHSLRMEGDTPFYGFILPPGHISIHSLRMEGDGHLRIGTITGIIFQSTPSAWRETSGLQHSCAAKSFQSTPSAWRETAKLHRKAFFISPILVQSCKKGCKRLHSAPEKMVFFEKREKNLVRNLQHLSVRL